MGVALLIAAIIAFGAGIAMGWEANVRRASHWVSRATVIVALAVIVVSMVWGGILLTMKL